MKKNTIVAVAFLAFTAVFVATMLFSQKGKEEETGDEAVEVILHRVEIEFHAPEGATGVTLYSNFNGMWDANSRSENGDMAFSLDDLPSGEYLFNLNFYDIAPYWACAGSPSLVDYPASLVGDVRVEVDGRPVQVELEDNHQDGCNLAFQTSPLWCNENPELCAQVIAGISAGFAVEIVRGNLLGL